VRTESVKALLVGGYAIKIQKYAGCAMAWKKDLVAARKGTVCQDGE
jgi:hypothetical protein